MTIEHLTFDELTKTEKKRYLDGDWLVPKPVKSADLDHLRRGPDWDEDAAAELAARVKLILEEAHAPRTEAP